MPPRSKARLEDLEPRFGHPRQPRLLPGRPAGLNRYLRVRAPIRVICRRRPIRPLPFTRLIVEKPFGRDLESRADLNRLAARAPSTKTRSTASTTTSARRRCRTSSSSASPTPSSSRCGTSKLRRPRADHRGRVARRGGHAAATTTRPASLRDMVQNHLLQLLAWSRWSRRRRSSADAIRDEKVKVLQRAAPVSPSRRRRARRPRPVRRRA